MALLTKYGTLHGDIPLSVGRIFWVGVANSAVVDGRNVVVSDNNDGLSPERPLATINQAVTNATADAGDTIMLLPGTYSFAATQTISKAGLRLYGVPGGVIDQRERGTRTTRFPASITTSAAADVLTITAARTEIGYLHIVPVSAQAGINLAANDANIHDITWNITTAANTATFGISVTGASLRPRMTNMYAYVADNQGPLLRCASATGGMNGGVFKRAIVFLTGTTAWDDIIEITTGVDDFVVSDCDFMATSGARIANACVTVTGNTNDNGVTVMRCIQSVGLLLTTATATSDVSLCNNYIATINGGTGGTLDAV